MLSYTKFTFFWLLHFLYLHFTFLPVLRRHLSCRHEISLLSPVTIKDTQVIALLLTFLCVCTMMLRLLFLSRQYYTWALFMHSSFFRCVYFPCFPFLMIFYHAINVPPASLFLTWCWWLFFVCVWLMSMDKWCFSLCVFCWFFFVFFIASHLVYIWRCSVKMYDDDEWDTFLTKICAYVRLNFWSDFFS